MKNKIIYIVIATVVIILFVVIVFHKLDITETKPKSVDCKVYVNSTLLEQDGDGFVLGNVGEEPIIDLVGPCDKSNVYFDNEKLEITPSRKFPYLITPVKHTLIVGELMASFYYLLNDSFETQLDKNVNEHWIAPESKNISNWKTDDKKLFFVGGDVQNYYSLASRYKASKSFLLNFNLSFLSEGAKPTIYFLKNQDTIFFNINKIGILDNEKEITASFDFKKGKNYKVTVLRNNNTYQIFIREYEDKDEGFIKPLLINPILVYQTKDARGDLETFGVGSWSDQSFYISNFIFGEYAK